MRRKTLKFTRTPWETDSLSKRFQTFDLNVYALFDRLFNILDMKTQLLGEILKYKKIFYSEPRKRSKQSKEFQFEGPSSKIFSSCLDRIPRLTLECSFLFESWEGYLATCFTHTFLIPFVRFLVLTFRYIFQKESWKGSFFLCLMHAFHFPFCKILWHNLGAFPSVFPSVRFLVTHFWGHLLLL